MFFLMLETNMLTTNRVWYLRPCHTQNPNSGASLNNVSSLEKRTNLTVIPCRAIKKKDDLIILRHILSITHDSVKKLWIQNNDSNVGIQCHTEDWHENLFVFFSVNFCWLFINDDFLWWQWFSVLTPRFEGRGYESVIYISFAYSGEKVNIVIPFRKPGWESVISVFWYKESLWHNVEEGVVDKMQERGAGERVLNWIKDFLGTDWVRLTALWYTPG